MRCDVLPPVDEGTALIELRRWLRLHARARRERVPFVAKVSWPYALARWTAESIACEQPGVEPADVDGLEDDELIEAHGAVGSDRGPTTVASVLTAGLDEAHGVWGRGEDERGFPVRDDPDATIVWRDLRRWDDLVRHTGLLRLSRDMLRPLVAARDIGAAAATEILS